MNLPIDFAGDEPDTSLPDPFDNRTKLNMQQAEALLLESAKSDVQNFLQHWKACNATIVEQFPDSRGGFYPAELTSDEWYEQFYAWMGV